jgi:uncharacterized protein
MFRRNLICFLISFCSAIAYGQNEIPELWGHRIHDEAHVLSQDTIDFLEKELEHYEDSTSNQIAVLIVSTLHDDPIEEYSLRVAEAWKLGHQDKDNGILLLVVVDDHKMRIEVGQGLEGVLTDAQSSRIIRNELAPAFRRNDYNEGVVAGVQSIVKAIGGEYSASDSDGGGEDIIVRILVGLFIFIILGVFTTIAFVLDDSASWWIYAGLIPFYAAFPWISIGLPAGITLLLIYIIGFPVLKKSVTRKPSWKKKMAAIKSSGRASKWSSTSGSSSGRNWSSSDSGSSFSGGGGSFGGGGSSGSW